MPSEPIRALSGVNVPGFPMAGFQLTLYGRIWVTPEAPPINNLGILCVITFSTAHLPRIAKPVRVPRIAQTGS
jgi:hypothetical protein